MANLRFSFHKDLFCRAVNTERTALEINKLCTNIKIIHGYVTIINLTLLMCPSFLKGFTLSDPGFLTVEEEVANGKGL